MLIGCSAITHVRLLQRLLHVLEHRFAHAAAGGRAEVHGAGCLRYERQP